MRLSIALLIVASVGLIAAAVPQERMKKKGPPDFKKTVNAAMQAFDNHSYGHCADLMEKAGVALMFKRREAIRHGMPDLGCKFKDDMQFENAAGQTAVSLFGMNAGTMLNRTYMLGDGATLKFTVTLNKGMAKTVGGMMNLLGMGGSKDSELIKYENDVKAILKERNNRTEWTMAHGGAHINVVGYKVNGDQMLKHMNQDNVNKLQAAISK